MKLIGEKPLTPSERTARWRAKNYKKHLKYQKAYYDANYYTKIKPNRIAKNEAGN